MGVAGQGFLPWVFTDHRALVVDVPIRQLDDLYGPTRRKGRFHFEEAWCEEKECVDIVDKFWYDGMEVHSMGNFRARVNNCGTTLHCWNRKKKKENDERVSKDPWLSRPVSFKIHDTPFLPSQMYVTNLKCADGTWDSTFIKVVFNGDDAELILGIPSIGAGVEDKVM
ncbi:hypothetical protein F8388_005810 [Cannabis sativa]|uniref:Uncharacterized protein n=1 Tax=Cannabis sativa TaxID=3483 RepID=A0A7J6HFV5_CANSA|nr:hypothetical protein F8388_005810 [Cannabis sativa]KAF4404588.1 hypothetical protein G4B88_005974 [Cannabis sativa]